MSSMPQGTLVIYPVMLHEGTCVWATIQTSRDVQYWLLPLTLGRSDEKGAHSQKPSFLEHSLERRGKGLKMPGDHKKGKKDQCKEARGGLNVQ